MTDTQSASRPKLLLAPAAIPKETKALCCRGPGVAGNGGTFLVSEGLENIGKKWPQRHLGSGAYGSLVDARCERAVRRSQLGQRIFLGQRRRPRPRSPGKGPGALDRSEEADRHAGAARHFAAHSDPLRRDPEAPAAGDCTMPSKSPSASTNTTAITAASIRSR